MEKNLKNEILDVLHYFYNIRTGLSAEEIGIRPSNDKLLDIIGRIEDENNPRHSDSDIERFDFDHKENFTRHHDGEWVKYSDMRDRMNGEMCGFLVWAVTNYNWHFVYWSERKNANTEYTTEQLLQKFRNRDL